jgi:hypothetical protein
MVWLCYRHGIIFHARLVRASWARWWVGLPGAAGAPLQGRAWWSVWGWIGQGAPGGQGAEGPAGGPISPAPITTRPAEHDPDAAIPGATAAIRPRPRLPGTTRLVLRTPMVGSSRFGRSEVCLPNH